MKIKDVSPHWFWLSFGLVAGQVMARYFFSDGAYYRYFGTEGGVVELLTPVMLLPAIFIGAMLFLKMRENLPTRGSRIWLGLVALGAFYMAGEEVSWGQWLFHWHTPETFDVINDQHETNLHNISAWFDQKPMLFLELWVLAGAIRAWYRKFGGKQDDVATTSYWFWPTLPLAWTGLLSAIVMMPERMTDWWGIVPPHPFNIRVTETQELVLGAYLSVYMASAYTRLKALKTGT